MICFLGSSHAPQTLAAAARANGLKVTDELALASLIFVSEDTPTNEEGVRNQLPISSFVATALQNSKAPVVITSQVEPGYTRRWAAAFGDKRVFHMAETLRIKDASERALRPEQFIIGVADMRSFVLPRELQEYCHAHKAPMLVMTYEEAEFSKIAINMFLASQVDTTNKLKAAAEKVGARWEPIAEVLRNDKRIGPHAYLTPGRWQDSSHLLRDHVTLGEILAR